MRALIATQRTNGDQGWLWVADDDAAATQIVRETVDIIRDLAEYFPFGPVLRRRIYQVDERHRSCDGVVNGERHRRWSASPKGSAPVEWPLGIGAPGGG